MATWIATDPAGLNRQSLEQSAKTAIASLVSILVCELFHLREFYWSAIATIVILQSTLGASLSVSVLRLIGDALGAFSGAVLGLYFAHNVYIFAAGVFLLGLLTAAAHLDRSAFRFAGVSLTAVMLIAHDESLWLVAWHRFSEIAVGIIVGLLTLLVWPERPAAAPTPAPAPTR